MLIVRDEQNLHVQAFTAGQHCKEHAHDEAKYEKFVYSTAFAFSVPKSAKLYKCGAFDSILGRDKQEVIDRTLHGIKTRYTVAEGPAMLCGVWAEIDETTGRASHVERIQIRP